MIITNALADAMATAHATQMGDFKLHFFGTVKPATSAALAGNLGTPGLTIQSIAADGGGKYGIKWETVVTNSRSVGRVMSQGLQGTVGASDFTANHVVVANVDDDLTANAAALRYVLSVGTSGADINLDNVAFTAAQIVPWTSDFRVPLNNT